MIEANVIPEGKPKPTILSYVVKVEERLYYSDDGLVPATVPIEQAGLTPEAYMAFKRAGITDIHSQFSIRHYPLKVVTKTSTL